MGVPRYIIQEELMYISGLFTCGVVAFSMLRYAKTSQFFGHSERIFANEIQMRICRFERGADGVPKLP